MYYPIKYWYTFASSNQYLCHYELVYIRILMYYVIRKILISRVTNYECWSEYSNPSVMLKGNSYVRDVLDSIYTVFADTNISIAKYKNRFFKHQTRYRTYEI